MNETNDLLSMLHNKMPELSKGQKRIANFLIEHYDKAVYLTASKLGEIAGVSESTVVRFAIELGYDGYPKLQRAVEELVKNKLTASQRMEVSYDRMQKEDKHILKAILEGDEDRIHSTLNDIDTDEFDNGAFYYQSGSVTNDYKVEKYVYFTVDKGGRCSAGEQKIIYSGNNLDTSVQANVQDIDSDTAFTELKEILTEEQYSAVLSDYQEDYIDHFEKAVWYDKYSETTNYYRQYKYAYGTARSIYEQCQNGLEAASNYTIADSVCDAVHCDEIGENGEYNAEYPLIFPANPEAQKPTYGGDENVLEVNGTKTTWGMSILASKEFNESIWHTNKYTTGEPSGVPADDVTNYPNDNGHPYGNNVVEKIYEIRGII